MTSLDIDTRSDIYSWVCCFMNCSPAKPPSMQKNCSPPGWMRCDAPFGKGTLRPSTRLNTLLAPSHEPSPGTTTPDVPKLIHLLRGDLDWIVMKSLEKDAPPL